MNGQAMSRLEEALLSSSTPLSNFHLTVSSVHKNILIIVGLTNQKRLFHHKYLQ